MTENTESQEELTQEPTEHSDNLDMEQGAPTPDVPEMSTEEKLQLEVGELKDKYIRLYADFENFRRRTAKERLELLGTANAEMLRTILPIVDDFERAMQSFDVTTEVEPLKEGVSLIYHKLYKALESKGLKPMESKGTTFDAELHESIAQFPAESEEMKGKIVDEVEKGYLLNDKVIRYAKVVVGV